ncbi:MAG TPA: DUF3007 domain-containing protein [Cyanothece sp. UBA12306]|nr:DUF3007 domain-containing protein [Cyanothece sp. UBA12306]
MRRIDVIAIGMGVFATGGVIYLFLQLVGFDSLSAGIWSQALFITVLLAWILSYLWRVGNKNMTYNQQIKDYEEAVLQKRLDEMTPEELEKLQQELEKD